MRTLPLLVLAALALVACADTPQATTTSATVDPTTTSTTSTTTSTTSTTPTTTSTTPTTPTTTTSEPEDDRTDIEVTVADGEVTGGGRVAVDLGEDVRLRVTSDITDEIHVHGFDLFFDIEAGETVQVEFSADVPGVFEIELERSGILLVELEVGG